MSQQSHQHPEDFVPRTALPYVQPEPESLETDAEHRESMEHWRDENLAYRIDQRIEQRDADNDQNEE